MARHWRYVSFSLVFNIWKIPDSTVQERIVYQSYTQYRAKLRQKEDGKEEGKGGEREEGERRERGTRERGRRERRQGEGRGKEKGREEGGRGEEGIVAKFAEIMEFPQFSFFKCSKNVHTFLSSSKCPVPFWLHFCVVTRKSTWGGHHFQSLFHEEVWHRWPAPSLSWIEGVAQKSEQQLSRNQKNFPKGGAHPSSLVEIESTVKTNDPSGQVRLCCSSLGVSRKKTSKAEGWDCPEILL